MKNWQLRVTIVITALWVIVMPLLWPRWDAFLTGCDCPRNFIPRYYADFFIGAACIVLLPGAWVQRRWAAVGVVAAAFLLPVLKALFGPSLVTWYVPAWLVSSILLLLTAWGAYKFVPGTLPNAKGVSVRALMAVPYGLAGIGSGPAYLYLVAGILAGFEGIASGAPLLGSMMSILSLCALFGLWTLWSIGRRVWHNGAYVPRAHASRWQDAVGMLAGWIAFAGFIAIRKSVDRVEEVVVWSVLLVPALALASVAFSLAQLTKPSIVNSPQERSLRPLMSLVIKLADLPGVASGAVAALALAHFIPRPVGGWGPCEFWVLFPIYGRLWRTEHLEVYDACSTGPDYVASLGLALPIVCMVAGAIAAAVGKEPAARRGALTAATVAAFSLMTLTFQVVQFRWLPSAVLGIATVAGAAWLGYLGGLYAEKNRWRLWWKSPEISPSGLR